ncbi:molybdate ABC transporter substrate-binding protein [Isoptericola sp. NPDC019693]|uniref:molybdate ABC transporter substrate-binding protein n=1 Tax=Isoptericola sp. NPDC019693 TaxID=3364009 RepID=UPI0037B3A2CB
MRRRLAAGLAALAVGGLAGCGSAASGDEGTTLTVFAAASLQGSFEDLAEQFEATHDGVDVRLSFAGSSDLVAQIQQGAPADVFASADTANMAKLTADGLVGEPRDFATNTLEIAVPPGNPAGVESLQDLAAPGMKLVLCAPAVPCGAASAKVADAAGLDLKPVSEEQSVTDVLGKVIAGEADAGLVYVTDVAAAGDDVEGIAFPESSSAVNTYPVATVADTDQADLAQQFVDLVLSDDGQQTLSGFGFAAP